MQPLKHVLLDIHTRFELSWRAEVGGVQEQDGLLAAEFREIRRVDFVAAAEEVIS